MPRRHMLRDRASGGHARVTYVELFFDLVFVFAVTQLSHGLMAHPTLLGVVETGLLLMAVWWAWIFTAWVTNWLDPERAPVRIMLFAVMVVGMVMTMSIPKAFGERGLIFALAFVAIQLGRSLFTAWAMRGHPFQSRNFIRISAWFATSGVLWIAGGLAGGGARLALWGGALALEYVSPALGFWTPGMGRARAEEWDVEGGHLAERCALFTIIALGESILVMGATTATLAWTPTVIAAFLASFAGSLAMWWIYFSFTAEAASEAISHAKNPGRVAREAYTYIHLLPIAGVIVTAVADEWTIHHPVGHTDLKTALALIGGPFLFLLGGALFKRAVFRIWAPAQVVGLLALAALAPVSLAVGPLVLSIATTVVLLGVSVREGLVHRARAKA
ncbi:low temperature requirement protein A [Caulobacter sp. UNC279MFTsu5.1]|uniref:low temperature requirement protein A n=1 Tax=Caulobacter sp. UNC279MFTsu5.1 TaxID=1502775 RepID=UPI0008EC4336|nr:low temperature requirement protein A [Caulobacter sp. UNC279MFTsu5.1]SFK72382.1 Low temperature requirement protein LtrA [Caulobacter sp. UNC279MFTsu5.1]